MAQLHANQTKKGTDIPYLAHLLGVASIALEHGADEDEAIAALLHDAIEDQDGDATRKEIHRLFGRKLVDIVNGCTDCDVEPKPPWKERKKTYIAHIKDASPSVHLVSAADKLHNARTILKDYRSLGDALWDRFNGGKKGTLWYYRSLVGVFMSVYPKPIVDELEWVISEIEHHVRVKRKETRSCANK